MKKILVADDDPDIVIVVKKRLEQHGYQVLTAENGIQAVVQAHQQHPDLIILDIKMPCGNGLSVYEKLKDSIGTAFIPVIFFTAHPSPDIRQKVLNWGASDFIAKPFTTHELITKVKTALFEIEEERGLPRHPNDAGVMLSRPDIGLFNRSQYR